MWLEIFFPYRLLKKRNPKKQHEMIHNSYEVAPWKIDQICWTARSASDTKNSNVLYRVPRCYCCSILGTYQGMYKNRVMNDNYFKTLLFYISRTSLSYLYIFLVCWYLYLLGTYLFAEYEISYFESKLKKIIFTRITLSKQMTLALSF